MSENQTDTPSSTDLESLRKKSVKELKEIAKSIGLKGVSALRKESLIERISNHRGSGSRDTAFPILSMAKNLIFKRTIPRKNVAATIVRKIAARNAANTKKIRSTSVMYCRHLTRPH